MATSEQATATGATAAKGYDASMLGMFEDLDAITSVGVASGAAGTATSYSLTLPPELFAGHVTDMRNLFRGCDRLQTVDLGDFVKAKNLDLTEALRACPALTSFTASTDPSWTRYTCTLDRMLLDCTALESVTFQAVPNTTGIDPKSMDAMFKGCTKLKSLDLRGLSTGSLPGSWSESGAEDAGMQDLFSGCTAMFSIADRAQITLGQYSSKLLNGFFWYRTSSTGTPEYVIQADIIVPDNASGPQSMDELMKRPGIMGSEYTGMVKLSLATDASGDLTAASRNVLNVWLGRDYINYSVNGATSDEDAFGNASMTGYVGHDDGTPAWNGTSVRWSLRTNGDTGITSLVIALVINK